MRLPRFTSLSALLLLPLFLTMSTTVMSDELDPELDISLDDLNRNEMNSNEDEPQIDLPEVESKRNPFRNVSQGVRKESQDSLVRLTQEAVDTTARRLLSTDQHTPWQMMHALLGLRHDFRLQHRGQTVNGLDWISQGQVFSNEYWFEKTNFGGRAHPYNRPYAFEGHANQFVAILSMCGVELDREFGTANGPIKMRSMVEHAKMSLDVTKDEPTWTLWALSRYLPPDARWRNHKGEVWSIERLVQEQTGRPMKGAACGGTHSLFALAHARNVYLRQGKPLRGVWLQAEYKIRRYIEVARQLQNSNGTLSSNYFRGREYSRDFNKRMASAGHVLEFLMIALPQEELKSRWVRRAIEATASDLMRNRKAYVKCSPLYHSVNALNIYLDRVNPRSAPEVATANDAPKTAMLTPGRLKETQGRLKGVPSIGISNSRELPSTDEAVEPEVAAIETPMKTQSLPSVSDDADGEATTKVPVLATKTMKAAISRDEEKWVPTPAVRRGDIDVSEEAMNREITDSLDSPAIADETVVSDNPLDATAEVAPTETTDSEDVGTLELKRIPRKSAIAPLTGSSGDEVNASPEEPLDTEEEPVEEDSNGLGLAPETAEEVDTNITAEEMVAETELESVAAEEAATVEEPVESEPAEEITIRRPVPVKSVSSPELLETPSKGPSGIASQYSENRDQTSPDINDEFLDPELNPGEWVNRFESTDREIAAERSAITFAVGLGYGQTVADIGAGTGLFLKSFSTAVGRRGRVYAIDISPRLVEHLDARVKTEKLSNVSVVRNDSRSLQLMNTRLDKAFVCDSYHHFEHHEDMLESIFKALKPGGELILVDFNRIPAESREWVMKVVRADKQTFRGEIESAGFQYVEEVTVPGLKEHYLLRFRRPRR